MLWDFPVGKCDLDSDEKDTQCTPEWNKKKYRKEREGFDLPNAICPIMHV